VHRIVARGHLAEATVSDVRPELRAA